MKITTKVLCQRVKGPLSQALHLDMSGLGIGAMESLDACPKLESLDLSRNCLEELENFECCKNLWRINLSDNQLSCLTGLSQMYAIGTLDLSNNHLSWNDLVRLRHVHILDLRLHGNEKLDNDTYYRLHVVDCLPNVWMLDGRLITSAERLQVRQFYHDSALSNRPVRHKLNEKSYLCSNSTKSAHIFGNRTCQFTANFPANEPHNSETDRRRLEFLAENIQEDLKIRNSSSKRATNYISNNSLEIIIKNRCKDKERCNMLLMLLIAALEFDLPESLIKQTLEVAKLNPMFDVDTMQFFKLDAPACIEVISLLVSSCKLDRDVQKPSASNFTAGGLYDRLYLCLYHSVSHLLKRISKKKKKKNNNLADWKDRGRLQGNIIQRPHTAPARHSLGFVNKKRSSEWKAHQTLLASELVLLLSVVPSFYHHITERNSSVCNVLRVATGDFQLSARLAHLSNEIALRGGDINILYREICRSVIKRIELAVTNTPTVQDGVTNTDIDATSFTPTTGRIIPNTKEARFILNASGAYPKRPKSAVLTSGEHLTTGRTRHMSSSSISVSRFSEPQLGLGSMILLGAQNLAKVIALPEPHVALVQMESVPAPNGSVTVQARNQEEHYCYVDVKKLEHDSRSGYWKPRGTIGDKITLQAEDDLTDTKMPRNEPKGAKVEAIEYKPGSSISKRNLSSERVAPHRMSGVRSNQRKVRQLSPPRSNACSLSGSLMITMEGQDASGDVVDKDFELDDLPPPQRPLSSLFCEKMELTLSESAFHVGMFPDVSMEWNQVDEFGNRFKNFRGTTQSTFITEFMSHDVKGDEDASQSHEHHDQEAKDFIDEMYQKFDSNYQSGQDMHEEQIADGAWAHADKQGNKSYRAEDVSENPGQSDNAADFVENAATDETQGMQQRLSNMDPATLSNSDSQDVKSCVVKQKSTDSESQQEVTSQAVSPCPPVNIPMPGVEIKGHEIEESSDVAADEQGEVAEFTVKDDLENQSFASDDEPELQAIADERTLNMNDEPQGDSEVPELKNDNTLEISDGAEDNDEALKATKPPSSSTVNQELLKRRAKSARVPKPTSKESKSRPLSAVVPHQKRVMFRDGIYEEDDSRPGSASSFQLRRTEAWRSSASSGSVGFMDVEKEQELAKFRGFVVDNTFQRNSNNKVKFNMRVKKPPPQRPTSPLVITNQQQPESSSVRSSDHQPKITSANSSARATPTNLQKSVFNKASSRLASSWLADGRNVHQESFDSKKLITSPRLPGYLEGTGLMPKKSNKDFRTPIPQSDVALHVLPSRAVKPFSRLPNTCYRRSFEAGQSVQGSSLGGSLVWHRPRFSTLKEVKKLTTRPKTSREMERAQLKSRR